MNFVWNFLSYLLAFLVGAGVVWLVIRSKVGATTEEAAYNDLTEKDAR